MFLTTSSAYSKQYFFRITGSFFKYKIFKDSSISPWKNDLQDLIEQFSISNFTTLMCSIWFSRLASFSFRLPTSCPFDLWLSIFSRVFFNSFNFLSIFFCWTASSALAMPSQAEVKSSLSKYLTMSKETMKQYRVWYLGSYFSICSPSPFSMRQFLSSLWQDLQLFWSLITSSTAVSLELNQPSQGFRGIMGLVFSFQALQIRLTFFVCFGKIQFFYKHLPLLQAFAGEVERGSGLQLGSQAPWRGWVSSASSTIEDILKSWEIGDES